jgi:predicted DNA-binding protein
MQKTQTLSLRVSLEFKRRLAEEARKDQRSVANYIEATLTRLWQGREKHSRVLRRSKDDKQM